MNSENLVAPINGKDLARELNLSQSTVSRILNGDKGHRISELTRQRVLETAKRLAYQPNAIGRSLRHGRTDVIGIHTSQIYDVRNEFLGTIVGALQHACGAHQLDLVLHNSRGSPAELIFAKLRNGQLDGLILQAERDDQLVALLAQSSLPVVSVADCLSGIDSVTCDDADGMRQLIDALWARGWRKFVFLAPQLSFDSVEKRQQVFGEELKQRFVPEEARRIIRLDFENVAPALEDLRSSAPVAVCCWNDKTAYALLLACQNAGVKVPEEIAIAGFDGFPQNPLIPRKLVTIKCPWEEVAATALRRLVDLIEMRQRKEAYAPPQQTLLPVTFCDGDTA